MAAKTSSGQSFDILIIGQGGRLQYEAVLLAASLRASAPEFDGTLYVGEPQPGALWRRDPRMNGAARALLGELGATILPFENRHFGESYTYGNKIEALSALPPDRPFLFLDTDTLITGDLASVPFDFDRPSASMRRTGTWPEEDLYWPGYTATWKSLYDRFGLDFESSLDHSQPDDYWQRYLYFNAGWFFFRSGPEFGERFAGYALDIRDNPPEEIRLQSLDPWLDQVALPLVIHSFGGGRPGPELSGLDGDVTCHWRTMPLLFARESDRAVEVARTVSAPNRIKKFLKGHEPFLRFLYQNKGHKARAMFDRSDLPRREQAIRNRLRNEGLWLR